MKIVHYSYDSIENPYCSGGGAYRSLMVHTLQPKTFNITFYSGKYKNAKPYKEKNINFKFLGLGFNYLISRIAFSLFANIHSLFVKADLIVIEFSANSPVLTFLFKPKKTIIQFHHFQGKYSFKKYFVFGLFPWIIEWLSLKFAKHIITPAKSTSRIIKEKYGFNKHVIPGFNGFNNDLLKKNRSNKKYILSLGRIDIYMKGLDILIPAFEKISSHFPKHKLVIAGRGSDKDVGWLFSRVEDSEYKDKIEILIDITNEKKAELLSFATLVCIPSRFEGWCIVAIEAAASSKATLGTKINGLYDSINDNVTGILTEPGNVNALSKEMKRLLADQKLCLKLGKNGYKWAQNYTWEKVAKIQEKFYFEVVNEN